MTTVTQIINDAFRASNLIASGASPTTNESTEALRYLNRIVKSTLGNEAGEPFTNIPIGSNNISRPSGYPWYDVTPSNNWYVPENTRVMLNTTAPLSLFLHPDPSDGSRIALNDIGQTLATNPVTIYGNGRLIQGQTSITLNTDATNSEWFYRADLADWIIYSPLAADDTFPFPEEFDDYFIIMLAMQINPSYGKNLDSQSSERFRRSRTQLRARYDQETFMPSERALLRMPKTAADRDSWRDSYGQYDSSTRFDQGWPN